MTYDHLMTNEEAIEELKKVSTIDMPIRLCEAHYMSIKALEQEPCNTDTCKVVKAYMSEWDKPNNSDAISRQAVLDALYALCDTGETLTENPWRDNPHIDALVDAIEDLPSVNPQEPKTGHWEWVQYDYHPRLGDWICSECKSVAVVCVRKEEEGGIPLYKYCPQCGTKMVEPKESEEV